MGSDRSRQIRPHFAPSDASRAAALTRARRTSRATVLAVPETPKERRKRIIAANLRRFREAQEPRMTQQQLADQLGVDRSHVVRWENQVWEPNGDHIDALARILGVEPYEFYREAREPNGAPA